jgi:protein-disulfide isomerase
VKLQGTAFLAAALIAAAGCNTPEAAREHSPAPDAKETSAAAPISDSAAIARADLGRIRGDSTASLWLVEISDFQCPFCKMWHDSTYDQISRAYVESGKVRLAYVNFPLSIHSHAMDAAEAAMCASVQGRFWEMHDALFRSQEEWARAPDPWTVFTRLASKAGVETKSWRACADSDTVMPLIHADADRAASAGVSSTPTFLLGHLQMSGAYPFEPMKHIIDSLLVAGGS